MESRVVQHITFVEKSHIIMDTSKYGNELPEKLAGLDIEEAAPDTEEATRSRVLRQRKPESSVEATRKRRTRAAPRKRIASPADLERIYLDKNTKLSPRALETISEEGGGGGRKLRRHIRFAPTGRAGADKARKRRARTKRLLGDGFLSRHKMSMQAFMHVLHALERDTTTLPPPPPTPHNSTESDSLVI